MGMTRALTILITTPSSDRLSTGFARLGFDYRVRFQMQGNCNVRSIENIHDNAKRPCGRKLRQQVLLEF